MTHFDLLTKRFADAGLKLRPARAPFARVNRDVFGLNIIGDSFFVWTGDPRNRVEVVATEKKEKQLVLLVHEPERVFQDVRYSWVRSVGDPLPELPENARVVSDDGRKITIEIKTPSQKRHFLCGIDERGCFAAQLPKGVSRVADAHEVLKSKSAKKSKKKDKIVRQGEWFFVPLKPKEREELEAGLKKKKLVIERNVAIGQAVQGDGRRPLGGNPHTAAEVIVIVHGPLKGGRPGELHKTAYVRGKVRHREHATVEFVDWVRVERNAEVLDAGRAAGIAWID